jgi:hypothetical protein
MKNMKQRIIKLERLMESSTDFNPWKLSMLSETRIASFLGKLSDERFAAFCLRLADVSDPADADELRTGARAILTTLTPKSWEEVEQARWNDPEKRSRLIACGMIPPDKRDAWLKVHFPEGNISASIPAKPTTVGIG